jgi:hypothetical protein
MIETTAAAALGTTLIGLWALAARTCAGRADGGLAIREMRSADGLPWSIR